ncbi:hypothetical protein B0H11DRAFT_1907807 [Mycena galericulata]|nr:hypothetical protein B0H11DRAFT_1907807 [Mycena galericulata]
MGRLAAAQHPTRLLLGNTDRRSRAHTRCDRDREEETPGALRAWPPEAQDSEETSAFEWQIFKKIGLPAHPCPAFRLMVPRTKTPAQLRNNHTSGSSRCAGVKNFSNVRGRDEINGRLRKILAYPNLQGGKVLARQRATSGAVMDDHDYNGDACNGRKDRDRKMEKGFVAS